MNHLDRCGLYQVASGSSSEKHEGQDIHDDGTPLCDID